MRNKLAIALLTIAAVAGCTAAARQRSADVERGRYVVEIMGCNDCHTPGYMGNGPAVPEEEWLTGATLGFHGSWGTAYPSNLRLLLNGLNEEEWLVLARRMRQGSPMAWVMLPKVTDADLRAVHRFVTYLGPKGSPAPARLPAGVTPTTEYFNFPEPH